ncbi:MAG: Serine/threonine-protein kinase [Vezdaea aestivalis]|nr:MAG: Serine/threonine-protein kinase [Vezdaea aestivalis]
MAAPRQGSSSSSRRQKDMVDIVGPFKVLDEIGRGSFAEVYKAIHLETKTAVAIKSVHLKKLNKKLKESLYCEIQILKGLHHPHIVALMDCHETPMHINLVMEYCSLGDLSRFIRKRDVLGGHATTSDMVRKYPVPPAGGLHEVHTRHFLKQISSAMEFLHARNFIHRDIKPQNMLLNPSPKYLRGAVKEAIPMTASDKSLVPMVGIDSFPMLKLADFGFARSLPSTSLAETLCGSPLYMAPEILRYEKYDAKADLWSVGTVIYEMVLGKPPFRASNHVELLKRIEKQADEIRFPADVAISRPIKNLIRGLLRRKPVQRISFEDFFASEAIQGPVPGLVEEDLAQQEAALAIERGEEPPPAPPTVTEEPVRVKPSSSSSKRPAVPVASPLLNRPSSSRRESIEENPKADRPSQPQRRFSSNFPNAAARHAIQQETTQQTSRPRTGSHPTPSPLSAAKQPLDSTNARTERAARDARRKADQDVAFERDYVVVEKKSVEVNAFADELAASPRVLKGGHAQSAPAQHYAMVRQTTAPGALATTHAGGDADHAASKAMAAAVGKPKPDHYRKPSYERRYGASPGSATSAISKALNLTSFRLFGLGFSPPLIGKGGQSPPNPYGAFPAYPTNQGSLVLIGDVNQSGIANEDQRAVQLVEDIATRSDVVYGFAGVKYSQLIPWTPSNDHGLGLREVEGAEGHEEITLTPDVTVILSEEALVLYVKALALLAKVMDIASAWWTRKRHSEPIDTPRSEPVSQPHSAAESRVNSVVQWARSRFNETLGKAEIVRLKLLEAQKAMPNRPDTDAGVDGVTITSGVTAEKLMYLRAVELNRGAAVNELMNADLKGCEIAYVTAHRMLEALLEREEWPRTKGPRQDDEPVNGIEATDRKEIEKMVTGTRARLTALKKKMVMLDQQRAIIGEPRRAKSSLDVIPPSSVR